MAIPNLPTDNLYKFIALTGFFMLIGSLGFIHIYKNRITLESAEVDSKLEALERENEINDLGFNAALKQMESIEDTAYSDSTISDAFRADLSNQVDELYDRRRKDFDEYQAEFFIAIEARTNSNKKIEEFIKIEQLLTITALLGFIMMIYGFILWYFKLQRHQDILIKHQALKALAELTSNKSE